MRKRTEEVGEDVFQINNLRLDPGVFCIVPSTKYVHLKVPNWQLQTHWHVVEMGQGLALEVPARAETINTPSLTEEQRLGKVAAE